MGSVGGVAVHSYDSQEATLRDAMLSRPSRRLLSTKVSRSLQGTKTESVPKNTPTHQPATTEKADSSDASAWSHFAAFSSMEDYVDVTLVQYTNNNKPKKDEKE
ncbi:hypothetical protein PR002_g10457 [Phytophthora rubi]|uniref:Uncharacterized protein n=1 Tax=Phytophthora rubi TaxID=129364 RepID=A0A6A3MBU4_9STRA|nr:hypothetical protein PR002_g10457 [Phytophthora rubi]